MMIILDVLINKPDEKFGTLEDMPFRLALNLSMGVRMIEDANGICWISCTDNSVWKSAHDFQTTCDIYANLFSQAVDTPYRTP